MSRAILAVVLALALPAAVLPGPDTVRIATYNIRQGRGPTDPSIGPVSVPIAPLTRRLDAIARALASNEIDVCCLQEVQDSSLASAFVDQAKAIARELSWQHAYAVADTAGFGLASRQGNAIVSRYPILRSHAIELPATRAGHERRCALVATIGAPGVPGGLTVISLHLDHKDEAVRLAQLEVLRRAVATMSGPIVVAGDLNSRVGSKPVAFVKTDLAAAGGERFVDTWEASGQGDRNTIPWNQPVVKIDWIFATPGLIPIESRVLGGVLESDHLPVLAVLRVDPVLRATVTVASSPQPVAGSTPELLGVSAAR